MVRDFDPDVEIGKLIDQLASHDKPVAFLFGAGTSASVKATDGNPLIPAVVALTKTCSEVVAASGASAAAAWKLIWDALSSGEDNVEGVLSTVRRMQAAITNTDTLVGLNTTELDELADLIQETISREVRPDEGRFPKVLPHASLARWIRRIDRQAAVEIFTTNYDTLIERALEEDEVPVFDGFVGSREPFFAPSSLTREGMAPGRTWTRLWKLHGSVTWTLSGSKTGTRVVRGGESATGELILPSLLKYDESRKQPYLSMLDRLKRVLTSPEDFILVAAGFGFGDQHINEVIFEALGANPRTHVFALSYAEIDDEHPLFEAAQRHSNLIVFGPNCAIVGGRLGTWRRGDTVSGVTARLPAIFTPDAADAAAGSVRLGDFNAFCELLENISMINA
jgi:hypothetical protein